MHIMICSQEPDQRTDTLWVLTLPAE